MTVTVVAILENEFGQSASLTKIMDARLKAAALELQDGHLADLAEKGERKDDLVVYLSYNAKYKIRYMVVNDVPADIENAVSTICGNLGYIPWRVSVMHIIDKR